MAELILHNNNLFQNESRMDSILFRAGVSMKCARQAITNGRMATAINIERIN